MADRNPMKKPIDSRPGEDDPFAELTRIMGFDPRVPVGQGTPPAVEKLAALAAEENDFSIDLEKELMGEFGDMDDDLADAAPLAHQAQASQPLSEDLPSEEFELDIAGEMEAGFHLDSAADLEMSQQFEPAFAPEAAADEDIDFPEFEAFASDSIPDADDNSDNALVGEMESVFANEIEADSPLSLDDDGLFDDLDLELTNEVAASPQVQAYDEAASAEPKMFDSSDFELEKDEVSETGPVASWQAEDVVDDEAAPLIPLGSAYETASAEKVGFGDTYPVDSSQPVLPAAELGFDPQDDLEAELNALLGRGPTASGPAHDFGAEPAWDPTPFETSSTKMEEPEFEPHQDLSDWQPQEPASFDALVEEEIETDPLTDFVVEQELLADLEQDIELDMDELSLDDGVTVQAGWQEPVVQETSPAWDSPAYDTGQASLAGEAVRNVRFASLAPEPIADDPFEMLSAMVNDSYEAEAPAARYERPDIDTIDVPESAIAVADDLDLPDVSFPEELPVAADLDDFEAELTNAFNAPVEPEPAAPPQWELDDLASYEQSQSQDYYAGAAVAGTAGTATVSASASQHNFDDDAFAGFTPAPKAYPPLSEDELSFGSSEDMAAYHPPEPPRDTGNRRGLLIAAIVGGVALLGGVGAFALSGGKEAGAPVVVRADTDPIKVRPENPGGTTVPNQDNKVFQSMNGTENTAAPTQETLISGTEEPVDMVATGEDDNEAFMADGEEAADGTDVAVSQKGEDRVAPELEVQTVNNSTLAVAPRRVRTMVVRADGTLVPSEEPSAPSQATEQAPTTLQPATAEETASLQPIETAAAPAPKPAPTAKPTRAAATVPDTGPVAPQRPADQPIDIIGGNQQPEQVALAGGAAATAAAGGWSVQIASQPSQEAAQSSYNNLSRRYSNVIGDKGVNIVKADVSGRGTFWRVRVPAGSRDEAISLCERYKSAGGNCFVSK
ncbi:hypothetical protein GA830_12960 [Mesorhizobium sp. NBSH29]|uniref:SPOR domain-containing protein n=1 Tax=Mesorhizobium sp. NBSH29 TaxID=2654249 RepID=UPI00189648AB|nr:SPOR domain-containing protein [Mesorhizobium sp. NBSH29]QPC87557.1 hypothetical protein GA830_12960 [Mesorhizobium sp. NBSH29]